MWIQTSRQAAALRLVVIVIASVCGLACSTAQNQQMAKVSRENSKPLEFSAGIPVPPKEAPTKLMLYGGEKHDVYLGCLSCERQEPESVFNEFGSYGSSYSPYSLWNDETVYGSVNSPLSPLNPRASTPPVVKDQHGKFHGYLTVNKHMPQVFESGEAAVLLKRIQAR